MSVPLCEGAQAARLEEINERLRLAAHKRLQIIPESERVTEEER